MPEMGASNNHNVQRKLKLIALTVHFLLIVMNTLAQNSLIATTEVISSDHGLSQNSVFSICQDKYGFMWFGTQVGVDRYDGEKMVSFQHERNNESTSLTPGYVYTIKNHPLDSSIWIGTEEGVSKIYYNNRKYSFEVEKIPTSLSLKNEERIIDLFFDKQSQFNHFWVITTIGIYSSQTSQLYKISQNAQVNSVIHLNNSFLLGTDTGLYKFDCASLTYIDLEVRKSISALFIDTQSSDSTIHAYCNDGTLLFLNDSLKVEPFRQSKHDSLLQKVAQKIVSCVYKTENGTLYLGTIRTGLYIIQNNQLRFLERRFPPRQSDLSSNLIVSIGQSSDKVIWIGTNGGGINKLNIEKPIFYHNFSRFDTTQNVPSCNNDIWAIEKTKDLLWLGTDGDGLALHDFNNKNKAANNYCEHIPISRKNKASGIVKSIAQTNDSSLLLGTEGGLFSLTIDFTNPQSSVPDSLLSMDVTHIHYDKLDEMALIGTANKGLFLYKTAEKGNYHIIDKCDRINYILPDSNRIFWIATNSGLWKISLDENQNVIYKSPKADKPQYKITTLFKLNKSLYIGTHGDGLLVQDLSKPNDNPTAVNGLPDNVIYGILKDPMHNGQFWISTNRGLSLYNYQYGFHNHYSKLDGLQHDEFNKGAFFISDSTMYFGGVNGLTSIPPSTDFTFAQYQARMALAYYLPKNHAEKIIFPSFERNFIMTEKLPSDFKFIKFRPIIFDYHNSDNNQFKYGLESEKNKVFIDTTFTFFDDVFDMNREDSVFFIVRSSNTLWSTPSKIPIDIVWSGKETSDFWYKLGLFILIVFAILFALYIHIRSVIQRNFQREWRERINAISRKGSIHEIWISTKTDLKDFFEFDYSIVWLLDQKRKVLSFNREFSFICFEKDLFDLQVMQKETFTHIPKPIDSYIIQKGTKKPKEINKVLIDKNISDHNKTIRHFKIGKNTALMSILERKSIKPHKKLTRAVIPLLIRTPFNNIYSPHYTKEREATLIGVIEVGYFNPPFKRLKNIFRFTKATLNDGIMYLDNCTQPLSSLYQSHIDFQTNELISTLASAEKLKIAEIPNENLNILSSKLRPYDHSNISGMLTNYFNLPFIKEVLKSLCEEIGANKGFILVRSFNEKKSAGTSNIATYNINKNKNTLLHNLKEQQSIIEKIWSNKSLDSNLQSIDVFSPNSSTLFEPLIYDNQVLGIIGLNNKQNHLFNQLDQTFVTKLAQKVSEVCINERYLFATKQLVVTSKEIENVEDKYNSIISFVSNYFGADYVSLWIKNPLIKETKYILRYCSNSFAKLLVRIEQEFKGLNEFPSFKVDSSYSQIELNKFYIVPEEQDLQKQSRAISFNFRNKDNAEFYDFAIQPRCQFKSLIIIPIKIDEYNVGFISILSRFHIPFNKSTNPKTHINDETLLAPKMLSWDESFVNLLAAKLAKEHQLSCFLDAEKNIYKNIASVAAKTSLLKEIATGAVKVLNANPVIIYRKENDYWYREYAGEFEKPSEESGNHKPKNPRLAIAICEKYPNGIFIECRDHLNEEFKDIIKQRPKNVFKDDFWERQNICCFYAIPLIDNGEVLGIVFFNYRFPNIISDLSYRYFDIFKQSAVTAIINVNQIQVRQETSKIKGQLEKNKSQLANIRYYLHNTSKTFKFVHSNYHTFIKNEKGRSCEENVSWFIQRTHDKINRIFDDFKTIRERRIKEFELSEFTSNPVKPLIYSALLINNYRENEHRILLDNKIINILLNLEEENEVLCDPFALISAFANIISNAIEAIHNQKGNIKITSKTNRDQINIYFEDDGIGIEKHLEKHIFTDGFTTKPKGEGIGLPHSKRIIEMHSGVISYERSSESNGSIFIVSLPLK